MGRNTSSGASAPGAICNKTSRTRLAKETLQNTIPALLKSNPRGAHGVASSELISSIPSISPNQDEAPPPFPRIRILHTDTLTAAKSLRNSSTSKPVPPAILNMASPLCPGGGFLNGASSQEEFLCMRSTLLPSLHEHYYRLPEVGAIYTPDVLVFRDALGEDLPKAEHYYVNIVSAAMLRFPDVDKDGLVNVRDEEMVMEKMRAVMRVLVTKGVSRIVLGAWGCGAYGNPVQAVARAWMRVLLGINDQGKGRQKRKGWTGVEEVVFAITDKGMVEVFRSCFEDWLVLDEDLKAK